MTTDEMLDVLQGRIVALELLTRITLAAVANGQPEDPIGVVNTLERQTRATMQNLDRPIDPSSDRIWNAAVDALTLNFDAVRVRSRDQAKEAR